MIKVLFFGRFRELFGCNDISLELTETTVAQVRAELIKQFSQWSDLLASDQALVAVNQDMAMEDDAIKPGDEVAFFPPVTGG